MEAEVEAAATTATVILHTNGHHYKTCLGTVMNLGVVTLDLAPCISIQQTCSGRECQFHYHAYIIRIVLGGVR